MKLCKDCKHARFPHPMDAWLGVTYFAPMCGHPNAPVEPVQGALIATCAVARGCGEFSLAHLAVPECGPEAKLFEERPPKVEVSPSVCFEKYQADTDKSWWRRVFGG